VIPGLSSLLYTARTNGSFVAIVAPTSVSGSGPGSATSGSTTATPLGGTGPYTYAWYYFSGFTATFADSVTSATTTFTSNVISPGDSVVTTFYCVITDSASIVATSGLVTCTLTYS
jgi:hypothetical protein